MKYRPAILLGLAGFFGYTFLVSFRYVHLAYYDWDMAYLNQILWALSHGRFYSSLFGLNFLGGHAEVIDVLVLPVFYFFQYPLTFSIVQIAFFIMSCWVLYRIALDDLGPREAFLLTLLYLIFPANFFAMCHDHNSESLAPFFIFLAIFFYRQKHYPRYLLSLFFLLLIKENTSLIVMMLGVWGMSARDRDRVAWGAIPFLLAGIYFYSVVKWVIPFFGGFSQHMLWSRYGHLGSNTEDILRKALELKTFMAVIMAPENIQYLLALFGVLLLPALLSPRVILLILPIAAYHIYSRNMPEKVIFYYYGAIMTPAIFYAVIQTLKRFIPSGGVRVKACLFFLGMTLLSLYSYRDAIAIKVGFDRPRVELMQWDLVHRIPRDAGVIASFKFLTPLSLREPLYSFHKVFDRSYQDPEYMAKADFHSSGPFRVPASVEYALIDFNDPWLQTARRNDRLFVDQRVASFLSGWIEIGASGPVKLFQRPVPADKSL